MQGIGDFFLNWEKIDNLGNILITHSAQYRLDIPLDDLGTCPFLHTRLKSKIHRSNDFENYKIDQIESFRKN